MDRQTETAQAKELLTKLESHPLTRQIRKEEAAEILARRRKAAEKIEALNEEAGGRIITELQARLDNAVAAIKAHDQAREGLLKQATEARWVLSAAATIALCFSIFNLFIMYI
jgi:hypothetical protein